MPARQDEERHAFDLACRRGRLQVRGEGRDLPLGKIGPVDEIGRVQVVAVHRMRSPIEERVTRTAVELDRIVVQRLVEQAWTVLVEDTDPQVDPVLQDSALDLVGRQRMEVDVDLTGPAPEGPQHVRQGMATLRGQIVDHGDREVADQLAAKRAHPGAEALQRGRKVLACFVDDPSFVGQSKACPPALAMTHAESPLQIADLAADGGLADVQGKLGCGESAALRDCHEDREQYGSHGLSPRYPRALRYSLYPRRGGRMGSG